MLAPFLIQKPQSSSAVRLHISWSGDAPFKINISELRGGLLGILGRTLGSGDSCSCDVQGLFMGFLNLSKICLPIFALEAKRHAQGVAELSYVRTSGSSLKPSYLTESDINALRHCWLHGTCCPHCQLDSYQSLVSRIGVSRRCNRTIKMSIFKLKHALRVYVPIVTRSLLWDQPSFGGW